jgi:macrodomain Ter protein organizer (MatP/YcbG family)
MDANEAAVIDASEVKVKGIKARRTKAPKPQSGKRSLNLSLDNETYERLAVHALRGGTTISELVTKLATENLREYHISRTAGRIAG